MPRHSDAREKMIKSAVRVMRERGVEAMSFNDVLTRADAPRGSVYHHFPLGKAQLVREATQWAGDFMADEERAAVAGGSLAALRLLVEYWRRILVGSDFAAGCPIVAVTVDGAAPPEAREIAGEAFEQWCKIFADTLQDEGVDAARARSLATTVIASTEGAVVLCRAERSFEPLEEVAEELEAMIRGALPNGTR